MNIEEYLNNNSYTPINLKSPFNSPVYFTKKTVSTMGDAFDFAQLGAVHGTLILADYQSGGRGRVQGRVWESKKGESMLATLILDSAKISIDIQKVPLLVGLALSLMCEENYGLKCEISWPNDILVNEKKLSGILCEFKKGFLLCGIGLNLNQQSFEGSYKREPVSIFNLIGKKIKFDKVASLFLNCFYELQENKNWEELLTKKLRAVGSIVSFLPGDPLTSTPIEGEFLGIDGTGQIKLKDKNGKVRSFISGEFLT